MHDTEARAALARDPKAILAYNIFSRAVSGTSEMQLVQIFLPLYDNKGHAIARKHFDNAAAEFSDRFGGLTAYTRAPATGLWKKRGGRTSRDDVVIYEVMCSRLQRKWWATKRAELEKLFRQERVLIRSHAITQL